MGHLRWSYKLNLRPRNQHCTDEAQKAETVLSAVSYIHIYIYIYIYIGRIRFVEMSFVVVGYNGFNICHTAIA